jgi:hypothetical protein
MRMSSVIISGSASSVQMVINTTFHFLPNTSSALYQLLLSFGCVHSLGGSANSPAYWVDYNDSL